MIVNTDIYVEGFDNLVVLRDKEYRSSDHKVEIAVTEEFVMLIINGVNPSAILMSFDEAKMMGGLLKNAQYQRKYEIIRKITEERFKDSKE